MSLHLAGRKTRAITRTQKMQEPIRSLAKKLLVPYVEIALLFQELYRLGNFSRARPNTARTKWWELLDDATRKLEAYKIHVLGIIATSIPNCLEMSCWRHFRMIQFSLTVPDTAVCYKALVAIGIKVQVPPSRLLCLGDDIVRSEADRLLPPLPWLVEQYCKLEKDLVEPRRAPFADRLRMLIADGANPNQLFYDCTQLKHLLDLSCMTASVAKWLLENTATNPFYSCRRSLPFIQHFVALNPWSIRTHHLYQDKTFQNTVFTFIAFYRLLRNGESFFVCLPIEVLYIIIEHLAVLTAQSTTKSNLRCPQPCYYWLTRNQPTLHAFFGAQ